MFYTQNDRIIAQKNYELIDSLKVDMECLTDQVIKMTHTLNEINDAFITLKSTCSLNPGKKKRKRRSSAEVKAEKEAKAAAS